MSLRGALQTRWPTSMEDAFSSTWRRKGRVLAYAPLFFSFRDDAIRRAGRGRSAVDDSTQCDVKTPVRDTEHVWPAVRDACACKEAE